MLTMPKPRTNWNNRLTCVNKVLKETKRFERIEKGRNFHKHNKTVPFSEIKYVITMIFLALSVFFLQVDFAKVPHYIGAIAAFLSSMLFVGLQTALTYKLAKTQKEYRIFYLRLVVALLMLIALLLSILPA